MNIPELKSNFRELNEILYRGYAPNVISTAMELGLFDVLSEEPMDTHTLAACGFGDFAVRAAVPESYSCGEEIVTSKKRLTAEVRRESLFYSASLCALCGFSNRPGKY